MTTMQETAICPECGKEMEETDYNMECERCLAKKDED